jgi:hypothetical protein
MGTFSYMLDRVMGRLHSVFSKDPALVAAISLQSSTPIISVLGKGVLTLTISGVNRVISTADNIQSVVDAINALTDDITASIQSISGLYPAEYLYDDQQTGETVFLYRPTSILTAEMSTYARELDLQAQRISAAEKELYASTADGEWLEYWLKDYYGVCRNDGETDAAYFQRTIHEIFDIRENNKALEILVKNAFGIDVAIKDAYPQRDELAEGTEDTAIGRFFLDVAIPSELSSDDATTLITNIKNLIKRQRAVGTDFLEAALRKLQAPTETLSATEDFSVDIWIPSLEEPFVPGPIKVGSGWKVGTPGLVVGNNAGVKEQAIVMKLNYPAGTVAAQYLYGG